MSNTTPYDDVHRTLVTDCKHLMIPLVNEVFCENYIGTEEVILLQSEILMNRQGDTEKRIQDSSFMIVAKDGTRKWYHLESQSTVESSMIVRMYVYDSQSALQNAFYTPESLEITFPYSAVLYLRYNSATPDCMKTILHTPGGSVAYEIPVIKLQTYSVDEIFEKKLYYLIPFHIFTYEKDFEAYETDKKKMEQLKEVFYDMAERLEDVCMKGLLDVYTKTIIMDMSRKVIRNIAARHGRIKKEVGDIMGGKVLMHQAKYWMNKGISQGISQGIGQGISQGVDQGLLQKGREVFLRMIARGYTYEEAQEISGLDDETVKELKEIKDRQS